MVATAPSAPSSLAGPSAHGRGASRVASDRQGAAWVAPENAAFEHLAHRPEPTVAARCIGRTRPHRRDAHPGRRRCSGPTRAGRYCRARYYHPGLQRFLSEDPIEFAGGVNLYAYVENDPLSFRDPFGLDKDKGRDNCAGGATTFENPVTRDALRAALAQQATRRLEQSGMVYQNRWTRSFAYRLIDDFWASQTGTRMDTIGWIEVLLYKPVVTFHTQPVGPKYPAYVGPSETDIKTFVRLYPRAGQYHVVVNESRVYTISPSGTACQIGWTPSAIAS